jgi:hypothetical protein
MEGKRIKGSNGEDEFKYDILDIPKNFLKFHNVSLAQQ